MSTPEGCSSQGWGEAEGEAVPSVEVEADGVGVELPNSDSVRVWLPKAAVGRRTPLASRAAVTMTCRRLDSPSGRGTRQPLAGPPLTPAPGLVQPVG